MKGPGNELLVQDSGSVHLVFARQHVEASSVAAAALQGALLYARAAGTGASRTGSASGSQPVRLFSFNIALSQMRHSIQANSVTGD